MLRFYKRFITRVYMKFAEAAHRIYRRNQKDTEDEMKSYNDPLRTHHPGDSPRPLLLFILLPQVDGTTRLFTRTSTNMVGGV
jgi:hypothetical protein